MTPRGARSGRPPAARARARLAPRRHPRGRLQMVERRSQPVREGLVPRHGDRGGLRGADFPGRGCPFDLPARSASRSCSIGRTIAGSRTAPAGIARAPEGDVFVAGNSAAGFPPGRADEPKLPGSGSFLARFSGDGRVRWSRFVARATAGSRSRRRPTARSRSSRQVASHGAIRKGSSRQRRGGVRRRWRAALVAADV